MENVSELDTDAINKKWKIVRTVHEKSSEACLGLKERKRKEWIRPDMQQAI